MDTDTSLYGGTPKRVCNLKFDVNLCPDMKGSHLHRSPILHSALILHERSCGGGRNFGQSKLWVWELRKTKRYGAVPNCKNGGGNC
jgi:hypothetical protein